MFEGLVASLSLNPMCTWPLKCFILTLMRVKMEIKKPQQSPILCSTYWSIYVFFLQQHNNLLDLSVCVSHTETQQYFGRKSCGWAVLCCCSEASQRPSCLLNERPVIPFTLMCISAPSNNKSQPAKEIWISPQKISQPFSYFLSFSPSLLLSLSLSLSLSLAEGFCSVLVGVIDSTMCHRAGE